MLLDVYNWALWTWKKLAIKKNDVFNVGFTFILHFHKQIFHNFRYCGLGLVKHKRKGSTKVNNLKCLYALLLISYYNYVFSFPFLFFFLNKDEKLKWEIMGYSCTPTVKVVGGNCFLLFFSTMSLSSLTQALDFLCYHDKHN